MALYADFWNSRREISGNIARRMSYMKGKRESRKKERAKISEYLRPEERQVEEVAGSIKKKSKETEKAEKRKERMSRSS